MLMSASVLMGVIKMQASDINLHVVQKTLTRITIVSTVSLTQRRTLSV